MRRRGFFGALAGLALAPLGVKAAEPVTYKGVHLAWVPYMQEDWWEPVEFGFEKSRQMGMSSMARQHLEDMARLEEDALWGKPPKTDGPTMMGIKHFIEK